MSEIGHNSQGASGLRLQSFMQRIERLEEEKKAMGADIREVYSEAKGQGFDVKIMRKVIAPRRMDDHARAEQQDLIATYMNALGMLADTPLGKAALAQVG